MNWANLRGRLIGSQMPIISDLCSASWSNWREGFKEVFVILFFSLMPLWLGVLAVTTLTLTDRTSAFVTRFASNSDLGILSASLLGPMLYMMFREDSERTGARTIPAFPSGLWFILIVIACCVIATLIYCFTYLATVAEFYNQSGSPMHFVDKNTVALISWTLFAIVVLVILFACTIRNSLDNASPRLMSRDTQDFVAQLEAAQGGQNEAPA